MTKVDYASNRLGLKSDIISGSKLGCCPVATSAINCDAAGAVKNP